MKPFKNSLHIFITFVSVFAFLGGWATLAHSRKPIQPTQSQTNQIEALPPLAPIPSFNSVTSNNDDSNLNIIVPTRRSRATNSIFVTRGS
jgi:hypothetical protein